MRSLLMLLLAVSARAECPSSHPYMCGSRDAVNQENCPECKADMFQGPCCDKNPDCVCDDYCGHDCNDGAAPVDGCDRKYCISPGRPDEDGNPTTDCWAGSEIEPCTCSKGTARLTGRTHEEPGNEIHKDQEYTTYYEYTCCTGEESAKNQGESCGDYKYGECDSSLCNSAPGPNGDAQCWAGTSFMPCTCSSGSARETGLTHEDEDWGTFYHYTCCPDEANGENQGIRCGDYTRAGDPRLWFLAFLTVSVVGCISSCVFCCKRCKCCKRCPCNEHNEARGSKSLTVTPQEESEEKLGELGERLESKSTTDAENPTVNNGSSQEDSEEKLGERVESKSTTDAEIPTVINGTVG